MEEYPEDLRTPPLPLVALLGLPELHSQITHLLRAEQPPLTTVSIFDLHGIGDLGGKERRPVDARLPPPVGILKAGWMSKHRQRSAAVVTACLERDHVYGDPNQWASVCAQIDSVKSVCRVRNMKLIILIVQALPGGEGNEDRLSALRKRAEIDARCCLSLVTQEPMEFKRCVARLGSVATELANIFYKEEGKRVKARLERRAYSSPDLSVRYNFKIAAYAEFRKDWGVALKHYEAAYLVLHEVPSMPMELQPLQRMVELRTVAEHIHFKVCTLLLHRGKEVEAVKWFRQHMQFGKRMVGPPEGMFLHAAWVSRQFKAFAELLQQRLASVSTPLDRLANPGQPPSVAIASSPTPVSDRELQPAFYFQLAAKYVIERRRTFEAALVTSEAFGELDGVDVLVGSPDVLGPPLYVGQPPRVLTRGPSLDVQRPTEAEYLRHALQMEKACAHSHMAIDLLAKAHDQYKRAFAGRMICQLGFEMGREYSHAGEYANARRLFDSVAGMFRKEAWVVPLAATLSHLRDCARRLGLLKEYVEYSMELAALPVFSSGAALHGRGFSGPEVGPDRPLDIDLQERIQSEMVSICTGAIQGPISSDAEAGSEKGPGSGQPLLIPVAAQSPLRCAFSVAAAFHSRRAKPLEMVQITVALLHHLPRSLSLANLRLCFSDPSSDTVLVVGGLELPEPMDVDEESEAGGSGRKQTVKDLKARSGTWKRWTAAVRMPSTSGRLECTAVELHIGSVGCVRCLVEGGAEVMPLWNNEAGAPSPPFRDGPWVYPPSPMMNVDEADALVTLSLDCCSPAMVGELLPVRLGVISTGHPIRNGTLTLKIKAPHPPPPSSRSPHPPISDAAQALLGHPPPTADDVAAREEPRSPAVRSDILVLVEGGGRRKSLTAPEEIGGGGESGRPSSDGAQDTELDRFAGSVSVPPLAAGAKWGKIVFLKWASASALNLVATLSYDTEDSLAGLAPEKEEEGGEAGGGSAAQGGGGGGRRGAGQKRWQVRGSREVLCEEPWVMSHQFVAPFRRDSLLLGNGPALPKASEGSPSGAGSAGDSQATPVLAVGEGSTLAVTVRSGATSDLRLLSLTIAEASPPACSVSSIATTLPLSSSDLSPPGQLCRKDEALAHLFRVTPRVQVSSLDVGTVCVRWLRETAPPVAAEDSLGEGGGGREEEEEGVGRGAGEEEENSGSSWPALPPPREVVTKVRLPAVNVVKPPLVVTVECPSHALLGAPFALTFRVHNTTSSLQALGYVVVDAPGFVLSGPHSGAVSVLPSSTYALAYILVPIAAGILQLPQVHLTGVRYKAKLHPAPHTAHIFVYPCPPPHLQQPPLHKKPDSASPNVPLLGAFKVLSLEDESSAEAVSPVA